MPAIRPGVTSTRDVLAEFSAHYQIGGGPAQLSISSTYVIAAATATSLAESQACLAAEDTLQGLSLALVRVLADDKDSAGLRRENALDTIEPRVVRILAGAEIQRREQADATREWIFDKWVMLLIAAGGWLAAIIIALYK